jgi:hypothetical protein
LLRSFKTDLFLHFFFGLFGPNYCPFFSEFRFPFFRFFFFSFEFFYYFFLFPFRFLFSTRFLSLSLPPNFFSLFFFKFFLFLFFFRFFSNSLEPFFFGLAYFPIRKNFFHLFSVWLFFFRTEFFFFAEYILSPFRFGSVIGSMLRRHGNCLFPDSYYHIFPNYFLGCIKFNNRLT